MDSAVLNLSSGWGASQMQRHFANDFVANEPSAGGTKRFAYGLDSNTLRQIVKESGRICKEARSHAGTEARLWMPNLLPSRTWFASRLAVKLQFLSAAYK